MSAMPSNEDPLDFFGKIPKNVDSINYALRGRIEDLIDDNLSKYDVLEKTFEFFNIYNHLDMNSNELDIFYSSVSNASLYVNFSIRGITKDANNYLDYLCNNCEEGEFSLLSHLAKKTDCRSNDASIVTSYLMNAYVMFISHSLSRLSYSFLLPEAYSCASAKIRESKSMFYKK